MTTILKEKYKQKNTEKMKIKMKIKVFSDFCSSEIAKENFERTFKTDLIENYGPDFQADKDVYITCDEDYTHAIILNKAMPILTIPAKNVLGLACEPIPFLGLNQEFVKYAEKHIGKYFIGDVGNLPPPFIEHHGYMWFDHPIRNAIIPKKNIMSIVFSQKTFAPGHQYRYSLVGNILNKRLPIDIYGRGCQFLSEHFKHESNIKGEFKNTEPYEKYMFTICVENFKSNHYFSEKIMTPIMCDTIPIYFGCNNIETYVADYCIKMTEILEDDLALIEDILRNPSKYVTQVKTSKDEIFDKVNLIKNIRTIFS